MSVIKENPDKEWESLQGPSLPTVPSLKFLFADTRIPDHVPANIDELLQNDWQENIVLELKWQQDPLQEELLFWIRFWHKQFLEHVGYLSVLIAALPSVEFNPQTSTAFSELPENQPQIDTATAHRLEIARSLVLQLKQAAPVLLHHWKQFETFLTTHYEQGLVPIHVLATLCELTYSFKSALLKGQQNALWCGSAWSSLIEHMREELHVFRMRLGGYLNESQQNAFFINMTADHVSFMAHLLDPCGSQEQRELVRDTLELSEEGYESQQRDVSTQAFYIERVQSMKSNMDPLLQIQQVPNIIFPIDSKHTEREHDFALEMMKRSSGSEI